MKDWRQLIQWREGETFVWLVLRVKGCSPLVLVLLSFGIRKAPTGQKAQSPVHRAEAGDWPVVPKHESKWRYHTTIIGCRFYWMTRLQYVNFGEALILKKVPVIKNEISHNFLICLATRMKGKSVKVLASWNRFDQDRSLKSDAVMCYFDESSGQ